VVDSTGFVIRRIISHAGSNPAGGSKHERKTMLRLIGKHQTLIINIIATILIVAGILFFCWAIKSADISVVVRGCFISCII
jgi:uncharacterized membrane protein HdeD (DUF308 family)